MKEILNFFNASSMRKEIVEGDLTRYIYTGKELQVVEYHFPPHKSFPAHTHAANEQMGYLVSGKMGLTINGKEQQLQPGDWYHAPAGVEHSARTYDVPSVLLDLFAPPREDLDA